jgi:hypothetical protein
MESSTEPGIICVRKKDNGISNGEGGAVGRMTPKK